MPISLPLIDTVLNLGKGVLDRIYPDPALRAEQLLKLEKLKAEGNLAELEAEVKLMLAQAEITLQEAKGNNWQSGWRPEEYNRGYLWD